MPSSLSSGLLGDALVDVVDSVRRAVRGALGTNQHRVAIVTRTWSGGRVGEGIATVTEVELDPPPIFTDLSIRNVIRPAGREEEGDAVLTGVSLRYTEAELNPASRPDTEVAYRVTDAHGQGLRPNYFVVAAPPEPRRGAKATDATDWKVALKRAANFSDD